MMQSQGDTPSVGARVLTADGSELGTVKEVSGGCFKVDAPLQPDYWLASDSIAGRHAGAITLVFTRDSLSAAKQEGPEHRGFHSHRSL